MEASKLSHNLILGGIMGLCVADALGVPVEFANRGTLSKNPVVDMRAYGTYNQPAGTWSDDTGMTLCLLDSLCHGLDYDDIMKKHLQWLNEAEYTPHGEIFDVGIATRVALMKYAAGTAPLACGGVAEYDNGNGSLMRILPLLFYLYSSYGAEFAKKEEAYEIIHNLSALTHAHRRSQVACGIYINIALMLVDELNLAPEREKAQIAVQRGIYAAMKYYRAHAGFAEELGHFARLERDNFALLPREQIRSSGYVVDTLEAAIWCLLQTENYEDCVLKAVNLGGDTDTVAAVAGGLAGLCYGYAGIPGAWLATIARRDYIEGLCHKFNISLYRKVIERLCSYIPYFKNATPESVSKWDRGEGLDDNYHTLPYPDYDETLSGFIEAVYSSNLMYHDYFDVIEKEGRGRHMEQLIGSIDTAGFELVRAVLTWFVRQERFSDGLWAAAVEQKVFLKILGRLRQLAKQPEKNDNGSD